MCPLNVGVWENENWSAAGRPGKAPLLAHGSVRWSFCRVTKIRNRKTDGQALKTGTFQVFRDAWSSTFITLCYQVVFSYF